MIQSLVACPDCADPVTNSEVKRLLERARGEAGGQKAELK